MKLEFGLLIPTPLFFEIFIKKLILGINGSRVPFQVIIFLVTTHFVILIIISYLMQYHYSVNIMMIAPVLFLLAIPIGLTSCNNELLKPHYLACEELCDLVMQKFYFNESNRSKSTSSNFVSEKYDQKCTQTGNQKLQESSIIFALSKEANTKILNQQCFKDFRAIEKGILLKEPWAMKVRDSSGEKESGFIWGHNYWLGSKLGCSAVQHPVQITLSDQFDRTMNKGLIKQMAPFKMDYRVVYLKHNSPWQVDINITAAAERIIHVGICLPSSCSSLEIQNLTQSLLNSKTLEGNNILDLHAEVIYVKDLKLRANFFEQKSFKIVTGFVVFTLTMTILAMVLRNSEEENKTSKLVLFVKCFDITTNARELFTLHDSPTNLIAVINGLKAVSCFSVIMFHVMLYMYFTLNNKTFFIAYTEQALYQYVSIVPLFVDLLFAISGFLQAYSFIKNEKQLKEIRISTFGQNAKLFGKLVLKRYLRLAPLYLVVAAITALLTSYIEDVSVFHVTDRYDQVCSKYWWRNVFLIQNFFDHRELCLNWSWSLACEMQFYTLLLGLLITYAKHPEIVKKLTVIGLITSILWAYIKAEKHQYQFSFDIAMHSCNDLYINPFIRITPYLVGSIGGYYLAKSKGDLRINPALEKSMWNVTVLVFIACIYSNFKRNLSTFYTIILLVAARVCIAMAVCWMIMASATGRGVWWSRILEWKFFQNINRLSYAIYLLNPLIITFVFGLSNYSSYVDPLQMSVLVSGFCVITYLASIVFSLAFEMPYNNLLVMLLRKNVKIN